MKCRVITLSELCNDPTNKRKCISALRAVDSCHTCSSYNPRGHKPCESRIVNPKYDDLTEQIGHLKWKTNELKEERSRL